MPLPVGIVPFRAPEPRLAVIIKVTYALLSDDDGSFTLVRHDKQLPLSLPTTSELPGTNSGDLSYPNDFVPRKTATDVFVSGHVHAAAPTSIIQGHFQVASVSRSFCAVASGKATALPLSAAYLRGLDGVSPIEPLSPRAVPLILDEHPADFDYSVYGAAPWAQRVQPVQPCPMQGTMVLRALWPGHDEVEVALPATTVHAILISARDGRIEVPLHCDTVWVHTDAAMVVLVFRGDVRLPPPDLFDLRHIIVWADEDDSQRTIDDVRAELARGAFAFTVTAEDIAEGKTPGNPAEIELVRYSMFDGQSTPTLSLERYATISAELAEGNVKRDEVLRQHGWSENAWLIEERAMLESIAKASANQDTSMALRYGELFMAARDALAEPWEMGQTVDQYIEIRAEMEVTGDPSRVLGKRGIRLAPWMRLDRRMTQRALSDPSFLHSLEERLREAIQRIAVDFEEPTMDEEMDS